MQIQNTVNTFLQSNTDFQTQCQKYIFFAQSFIIAVHGQYHFVTCITYIDKKLKI